VPAQPHAHLHPVADALGVTGHQRCRFRIQHLARGFAPQRQPALEVRDADRQRLVPGQRIAAVVAGAQHHRRPERRHQHLVRIPIVHQRIEHRTEQRVGAHLVVETVDQRRELALVEVGGNRLRHPASVAPRRGGGHDLHQ
jgi:hypothetical protein